MDPFVVADLAEQVGQRIETRAVVGERQLERLGVGVLEVGPTDVCGDDFEATSSP